MGRRERLFEDRERPLIERLGLPGSTERTVEHRQVVEGHRHVGMVEPEDLLLDRQRSPVEPLGLSVSAGGLTEGAEVVEIHCELVVLRTKPPFEDRQGAPVERLRFLVPALSVEDRRQRGHVRGNVRMLRSERFLANSHGPPRL